MQTQDQNYKSVYEDGKNRVHPFVVPRLMMNAASSHVSMNQGAMGPCFTVSTACASSNHAMGQAFQMVRSGAAKVMLTGGSDSMLCFGGIKAWEGLRVLSPDGCRPFCATRNGMVQGEGAAIFVFEDHDHDRLHRRDCAAWWQGSGWARAIRRTRACFCPPRRDLPHLGGRERRSGKNQSGRDERQNSPNGNLRLC